jgi:uncharacterized membrane protein
MSSKNLSKGFIPAIEKCGELLAAHFPRNTEDENELPNHPILRNDYE